MTYDFNNLTRNPMLLAGTALLAGAGLVTLMSLGILLLALFREPEIGALLQLREPVAQRVNPGSITERNFFGLAEAEPTIDVEQLPETKLELVLRGAFAANDSEAAGAIIEDDRKVANHYAIGDQLPGEATLRAIYADRVVLARNGLLETLYFPEEIDTSGIGERRYESAAGSAGGEMSQETREASERREAIRERIRELRGRR
ncbi:MAG: type II secretion system protein N [Pseudomonadales bacterium]